MKVKLENGFSLSKYNRLCCFAQVNVVYLKTLVKAILKSS